MTINPEGDPTEQANPSGGRDETVWRRLAEARLRKTIFMGEQGDVSTPDVAVSQGVAVTRLLDLMASRHIGFEMRTHHEARHARHLSSMWEVALSTTVRATLMAIDGSPVLVAVPADRKIDAPGVRARIGAVAIAVLRGDRGVGLLGWVGMEGQPGALPCLPGMFGASLMIDPELTGSGPIVVGLGGGQSFRCDGTLFAEACGGTVIRCVGRTRLLPEGGMVVDPPG